MSGAINIYKQRAIRGIEPLESTCRTCLYFNKSICKFNKVTQNRKHCIKYEFSESMREKQTRPKIIVKKTSFKYLSEFFGVDITFDKLQRRYKSYDNGYSLQIRKLEPLTIILRSNKTKEQSCYEIIE